MGRGIFVNDLGKRRTLLALGTMAASSTLASLLAAEIVLRAFYPAPYLGYRYIAPQRKLFQHDPLLGWAGRPNAEGIFASADFRVSVKQDRFGNRNLTPPLVSGKMNVLVLGDSFGWGWGVEADEVFSARINSGNDGLNLYNLSAPGYGTDQEYLSLIRFLSHNNESDYAGVLLLFYFNDMEDVLRTERHTYPKPRFVLREGELVLQNIPVPETMKADYDRTSRAHVEPTRSALNMSHLFNLIQFNLSTSSGRKPTVVLPAPERNAGKEMSVRLLEEINLLCKKERMFFHVVLLDMANTEEAWRDDLNQVAIDLAAANIETSSYHSQRFPSTDLWLDGHLSPHGHKRLAAHVLDELRATGHLAGTAQD